MLSAKKLISGFVSLTLGLSLACAVFASPATPAVPEATEISEAEVQEAPGTPGIPEDIPIDDSGILSVIFPTDISFVIDPFEVKGRGQVFSEEYAIENHSGEDIAVSIESFCYEFINDADFQSLDAPFNEEEESDLKAIYMQADFSNGETLVFSDEEESGGVIFLLKSAEAGTSGVTGEGSRVTFSFSGSVNPYPVKKWSGGDVKVRMRFLASQSMPEAEEEAPEDQLVEEVSILRELVEIPDKQEDDADLSEEERDVISEPEEQPEASSDKDLGEQSETEPEPESEPHDTEEPEAPDQTEPEDQPNQQALP